MKVSIIVPIYNVEQYLTACLESIIRQTLKDIEIILVNDGSTDGSLQIAERFAVEDERIRLVSQKNAGQAAARNAGLEMSAGEYVVFVDSDDWLEKEMLEVLYEHIIRKGSDFVQCRFQFDNPKSGIETPYGREFTLNTLSVPDILRDALLVENILVAPWAKIFNRKFLIDYSLKFESGIVNEDTLFTLLIACCAQRVSFVNKIFYHAIEREGSTSRSSYERLCQDMVTALEKAKEYMERKGVFHDVEALYYARYLKSIMYNILQMAQRLEYKDFRRIWESCCSYSKFLEYNTCAIRKKLPLTHRVMLVLCRWPVLCFSSMYMLNRLGFRMH